MDIIKELVQGKFSNRKTWIPERAHQESRTQVKNKEIPPHDSIWLEFKTLETKDGPRNRERKKKREGHAQAVKNYYGIKHLDSYKTKSYAFQTRNENPDTFLF